MEPDSRIQSEALGACALMARGEWLGILDNQSNLHYLKNNRTVTLQKFNSPLPKTGHGANIFSADGNNLCLWLESKKRHYLLTYNEIKRGYGTPRVLPSLQTAATASAFSPDGTLLALGSDDGHLWIIHTASAKALWQLPKCGDAICSIAFNAAGSQIAYGSFMRDVTLYDLGSNQLVRRFTYNKDHPVILIRFLNAQPQLILGTRNNELALYEIDNKRSRSFPTRLQGWPTALWIDSEDGFALAGDKSGGYYLMALDERQGDVVRLGAIGAPVVDIRYHDGICYLLSAQGEVALINHKERLDRLEKFLELGNAQSIIMLGKAYPPLRHVKRYGRLKKLFDETAEKALGAIAKHNLAKAETLLAPFAAEPRFSQPIGALGAFTPKIQNFSEAIEQDRTDQAYAMVQTNGFYKRLEAYRKLEKRFAVQFRAAALMLTDKRPDIIGAKRAVEAFSKVPAKSKILQNLFEYPNLFKAAEDILKKEDYETFKRLSEKYPILKEAPFYARYEAEAEAAIETFETMLEEEKIAEALAQADLIKRLFTPFAPKIEAVTKTMQIRRAFEEAWRDKNYLTALSYAQRHPALHGHRAYALLMRYFNHRFSAAATHAFNFEFEPMHAILGPFLKNRYFKERALIIYEAYYLEELSRIGPNLPPKEWPGVLKRFVERFGHSMLLSTLCARFQKEQVLAEALVYQERGFTQKPLLTTLTAAGL